MGYQLPICTVLCNAVSVYESNNVYIDFLLYFNKDLSVWFSQQIYVYAYKIILSYSGTNQAIKWLDQT